MELNRDRMRLFWLIPLWLFGSCSPEPEQVNRPSQSVEQPDADTPLPTSVVVGKPDEPLVDLGLVEDFSEAVANRFVELADKQRRRDFTAARDWIDPAFVGDRLSGLPLESEEALPLGARSRTFDTSTPEVVGRTGFLAALAGLLSPWERVEAVVWKVKGAEFQNTKPDWGRIKTKITMLGSDGSGGPRSIVAWAWTRVERKKGNWLLTAFELTSLEELSSPAPLFTDVATSTGVANTGVRFGQPGNQSFAWNGVAAGDVNGDGRWDLFVPSTPKNFLYIASSSEGEDGLVGWFQDEAAERGVEGPAGGTGAVFFDFDNDGDQDLALAGVGWKNGGDRLRFWRNDGQGKFEEVGEELGFADTCHGFALVALDAEGDGWVDLFVCNYGRVKDEPNNSWIQATNGTPNRYYQNLEGKGFRECAQERGLADSDWSYAAAAADVDGDGDQDLYVANDYGRNHLWANDGAGRFQESAEEFGVRDIGNGMGCAWGDLNQDGALDLYVSNMSSTAGNRILQRLTQKDETWSQLKKLAAGNSIFLQRSAGDGEPRFELAPGGMGGIGGSWAWSPALCDLDLDGRLDVYLCNGFVTGDTPADT